MGNHPSSNAAGASATEVDRTFSPEFSGTPDIGMASFEFLRPIANGGFGEVFLARDRESRRIYAIKVIDKARIIAQNLVEQSKAEEALQFAVKDHPFIVNLRAAFQTKDKLCIVLDYVPGGDLFERLKEAKTFSEPRARLYAAEISMALEFLHSRSIVYRDLKLENVLLDEEGHIKLCDFGLAKQLTDARCKISNATGICGTPEYASPEMLTPNGNYGLAIDWWAFGVLLYAAISGKYPFWGRSREKLSQKILSGDVWFPPSISADARDLISRLLDRNPATRLSGSGVRAHPFFATIDWAMVESREYIPEFIPDVEVLASSESLPKWATAGPPSAAASPASTPTVHSHPEVVEESAAASDRVTPASSTAGSSEIRRAIEACKVVVPPSESTLGGWIIASINKWNVLQIRVLLLTNQAMYRIKYNFHTGTSIEHVARTCLSDITAVQRGEIFDTRFGSLGGAHGPVLVYGMRLVSSSENLEQTAKARTFAPFLQVSDEMRKDRAAMVRAQTALTDDMLGAIIAARDLLNGEITEVQEVAIHRETLSSPRARAAHRAVDPPRVRTLTTSLAAINGRIADTERLLAELTGQRAKLLAELDSLGVAVVDEGEVADGGE